MDALEKLGWKKSENEQEIEYEKSYTESYKYAVSRYTTYIDITKDTKK